MQRIFFILGFSKVLNQLNKIIKDKIKIEDKIVRILVDAYLCERYLSKPHNRRCPSMYSLITTCYDVTDFGYHEKALLKLRATPQQLTNYSYAIDLLLMIKEDVSDDPVFARKLLWLRASRIPFTKLAKLYGFHRTTIKRKYEIILERLSEKVRINCIDKFDKIFI